MPDPTITELVTLMGKLSRASGDLVDFLEGLDINSILEPVGVDPCDPIFVNPNPPTIAFRCDHPAFLVGQPIKVHNFLDSLSKLDAWIQNIEEVAKNLDPNLIIGE